jgi:amino acid adenylation domain-containing protein
VDATLFQRFARSAGAHPGEPALEIGGRSWSYADLAGAVDTAAEAIARVAGGVPATVALFATRTCETYVGYLAAGRLGATVVPLSERHPVERQAQICEAAGASLVLCSTGALDAAMALAATAGLGVVELSGDTARLALARENGDHRGAAHTGIAYILFTSGSTGKPKGVPIRHSNLGDYIGYNVARYDVQPGDRLSQTFELTFDPSVFDISVSWTSGACLVVPTADELLDPVAFVAERGITHWFSVPSLISLARRLRRLAPEAMPTLRWSLFAGEQLSIENADAWGRAAPNSTLENLYGPTELTITCTAQRVSHERTAWRETANGTVPIGEPYPHLEAVLLDDAGEAADVGELCVRGSQRFPGYLDPGENEGRFVLERSGRWESLGRGESVTGEHWYRTGDRVERTLDGALVHLGRVDQQVKFRGYRIELGEIEGAIRRAPGVADAAVVPRTSAGEIAELLGFYSGDEEAADEIGETLRRALPDYMVPRRLRHVSEWPLNANGKTDRAALLELAARSPRARRRAEAEVG